MPTSLVVVTLGVKKVIGCVLDATLDLGLVLRVVKSELSMTMKSLQPSSIQTISKHTEDILIVSTNLAETEEKEVEIRSKRKNSLQPLEVVEEQRKKRKKPQVLKKRSSSNTLSLCRIV